MYAQFSESIRATLMKLIDIISFHYFFPFQLKLILELSYNLLSPFKININKNIIYFINCAPCIYTKTLFFIIITCIIIIIIKQILFIIIKQMMSLLNGDLL